MNKFVRFALKTRMIALALVAIVAGCAHRVPKAWTCDGGCEPGEARLLFEGRWPKAADAANEAAEDIGQDS